MVLTYLKCVFNTQMLCNLFGLMVVGSILPMLSGPIANQLELLFLLPHHTPEHNKKAEHLQSVLQQSAKSMLLESGLPITFWPEAVLNANFVQNQSLLSRDGVPPSEKWFGTPVDLTILRTFGSQCFSHVPAKQRLKQSIVSNNIACFFLGYYNKDGRYYRLLDPSLSFLFSNCTF